jgi:hypothetical protein
LNINFSEGAGPTLFSVEANRLLTVITPQLCTPLKIEKLSGGRERAKIDKPK